MLGNQFPKETMWPNGWTLTLTGNLDQHQVLLWPPPGFFSGPPWFNSSAQVKDYNDTSQPVSLSPQLWALQSVYRVMVLTCLLACVLYHMSSISFCSVTDPGGGTLGISGWGYAARTLEPLAYTRASFSWILQPYTQCRSKGRAPPSFFPKREKQTCIKC